MQAQGLDLELRFRVKSSCFKVWGLEFRVEWLGLGVGILGCKVWGVSLRVYG